MPLGQREQIRTRNANQFTVAHRPYCGAACIALQNCQFPDHLSASNLPNQLLGTILSHGYSNQAPTDDNVESIAGISFTE
jgi:hypothetical protein